MAKPQIDLHLHPKQTAAFESEATEILYGGAAGAGKSYLIRAIAIYLCMMVKGLQVYLFRRLSDDLIKNHMQGAGGFFAILAPFLATGKVKYNATTRCITFWNGACIWLCHCQYEKDVMKYQGADIHVLLIDELTHFTDTIYTFLRSRLRLGELAVPPSLQSKLPFVMSGTNPGSAGHNWVKAAFVTNAPPMKITRMPKEEGGKLRQFIPARLADNPSLDFEDYSGVLAGLANETTVKALLDGNWDIVAGGALDDVWSQSVHVVPRFAIPDNWRLTRSFDWGSSQPFSVGFWGHSNGEEIFLPENRLLGIPARIFAPQPGSLIRFSGWYGTAKIGSNKGLKLSAVEIAEGIRDREQAMRDGYWIKGEVEPGPADNSIFNLTEKQSGEIAKLMYQAAEISWIRSDKSKGSRIAGLEHLRTYMRNALKNEGPGIYFMENCIEATGTLPVLPRCPKNQEDVDTKSEDHVYDDTRYELLNEVDPIAENLPIIYPT